MGRPLVSTTAKSPSTTAEKGGDHIWTERAGSYGWDTDASLSSRLKVRLLSKYVSAEARLCDVGCGNGLFLRVIASQCAHATGVDLNADMIAEARAMVAREKIENIELIQCSASALPFPDKTFDMVYCLSTLLLLPDVEGALSNLVRILRDGGFLVLDVAGRNNLATVYWHLWYRRQGHFGIKAFSFAAIEKKLNALGCRVVESHALGFCDQWKYVPGLHLAKWLDRVFQSSREPDRNLDYRISNLPGARRLASRWYIVARKDVSH